MIKRWFLVLAFIATSACTHLQGKSRPALAYGSRYVAMGSSFAAGPGLGDYKPDVPRCTRSNNNYATLLAKRLDLLLVDVSCGGATTAHVLGRWNELPAQIDAVTAETTLVTVTIGGNDLGYVRGLLGSSCRAGVQIRPGPCWEIRKPAPSDYTNVEANLRLIATQVRARAPSAKLVFVQYVSLLPASPCTKAWFTTDDSRISRGIAKRLAAITRRIARETGSGVLAADALSASHTPCSPEPWSNGMYPGYDGTQGASWHPNAHGMRAIADALAQQLQGN